MKTFHKDKIVAALAAALLICGCKGKPAPAKVETPQAPGAPTGAKAGEPPEDLSSSLKSRIEGTIRQNLGVPQQVTMSVGSVSNSDIPGFQKGELTFSVPGRGSQNQDFYITTDKKFIIMGRAFDLSVDPAEQARRKADETVKKIDLSDVPSRGPENAKVTIVEYSDFQCPFCSKAYATLEGDILKKYGKKVRFVYKNFPLTAIHPWAESAAVGAECAYAQNKKAFWTFYDNLYKNQSTINAQNLRETLTGYAKEAGLKVDAFTTCYDTQATKDRVQKQMQEASAVGIQSTPSFFINGQAVIGSQPADAFEKVIKEELAK